MPGASGDVDWRLEAGDTVIYLEAKFRRSDWARLVHPETFIKSGDGFLSKALHKFPVRKPGTELHVVGITVFDEGSDWLLSAIDDELQAAPQIHGVVIRGLLQMTHVLARDASVADQIKQLVAVPDGGLLPRHYPVLFHIEQRDERKQVSPPLSAPNALRCCHHWIGPIVGPEIQLSEPNLYRLSIPKRESNGEPHFQILPKYLVEQTGEAVEGFHTMSAARMREIGLTEEQAGLRPPPGNNANGVVQFTRSAAADWDFLHGSRIVGAPMQLDAILAEGLDVLTRRGFAPREIESLGGDGAVWYQRGLCWVIRLVEEDQSIVVHGIAQVRLNPFRKIWRYFDQQKAIDLLKSAELYLCRLDRLKDTHEARPTNAMEKAHLEALRIVFGNSWPGNPHWYDNIRRALYVTCFQKYEIESAEMWREYCPGRGGLAIQVTERALQHEFAQLRDLHPQLFFRDIDYIDHETHNPTLHGVPEQAFLKRRKFKHEREIRLARFIPEAICGTQENIERYLRTLPDHYRIPFDLEAAIETIVLNPACSVEDRAALVTALEKRPGLLSRVHESTVRPY